MLPAALQAGRRDGTRAVGRQLSLRCIGGRLLFAANDREPTRVCRFLSALRGTQYRCVRKLNCSGFDAGFMVETSPAGTSGVERSRRSYSSGDVVELAVQPATVPVDSFHGGVFDVVKGAQRTGAENGLRGPMASVFEQPDRCLGQNVVVIADAAN